MVDVFETKDSALIAELNEEVQTFHHVHYPSVFKPYDKEAIANYFKSALANDNTIAFVAKEKDQTLGYALVFIVNFAENPFQYARKYILLDQVLVSKIYRSQGVGKRLLEKVFEFAKANGIGHIELNHWTLNDSARNFFCKNEFKYYNEKMWRTIE